MKKAVLRELLKSRIMPVEEWQPIKDKALNETKTAKKTAKASKKAKGDK